MADPALAPVRDDLYLGGISVLGRASYDGIAAVEQAALAMGYAELA